MGRINKFARIYIKLWVEFLIIIDIIIIWSILIDNDFIWLVRGCCFYLTIRIPPTIYIISFDRTNQNDWFHKIHFLQAVSSVKWILTQNNLTSLSKSFGTLSDGLFYFCWSYRKSLILLRAPWKKLTWDLNSLILPRSYSSSSSIGYTTFSTISWTLSMSCQLLATFPRGLLISESSSGALFFDFNAKF